MILVAIGANLPGPDGAPPVQTCREAAAALDRLPGLRLRALSRWWRSAPDPPSDQPSYVNGVAQLEGTADPAALLAGLQEIERRHARVRGAANAARTLDLDIVSLGMLVRDRPDPVLPHPRAHLRGFVLLPLAELAPRWVHPALGVTVAELIARLPPQDLDPL